MIQPTVDALKQEGMPFVGVLFAGLMVEGGRAQLLEYNVRFGDPECQALMVRLQSDLVQVLLAACTGGLKGARLEWSSDPAVVVVVAAKGYPGEFARGEPIRCASTHPDRSSPQAASPLLRRCVLSVRGGGLTRAFIAPRGNVSAEGWRTRRPRGRLSSTQAQPPALTVRACEMPHTSKLARTGVCLSPGSFE